ncbi:MULTISPECIES: exopolyphosphatase [unclassified Fusibacter]|uniref:exopolyphosphatase n=1 Tax=unclassified Fusibacter TaxID=2624464 RepID=UPI0019D6E8C6|nr:MULTISPECIES: exopolyphosphatase [unclassified Fusibacter]MCK8061453.1 exopolyphosphatase [Fusibacter sp. A2]
MEGKYRLITRSDFDGLVCAVLLKDMGLIDDIKFVHPKDMQDGIIQVTEFDITTNLPYVSGAYLAFDHHLSETIRNQEVAENHIIDPNAPSAARVVYDYYKDKHQFREDWQEMLLAVDKADSAQFTKEDILEPKGWELLSFLMDARTGLGRFRAFRISNYTLMMELIDYCRDHTIDEILELPDVKERVELYFRYEDDFKKMIQNHAKVYDEILVVDLRDVDPILPGNRFIKYALYPETQISIQVMWGLKKQNTVFTVGKSIINRSSDVNIGEVMLQYGGGGHKNAGTCQIPNDKTEELLVEVIGKLKA